MLDLILNRTSELIRWIYEDVASKVNVEERNRLLSDDILNRIIELAKKNEILAYVFIRHIPLAISRGVSNIYAFNDLFVDILHYLLRMDISVVNLFVKTSIYAMEKGFDKKYFTTIRNILIHCKDNNEIVRLIESVSKIEDPSILQDYFDIVNILIPDCRATNLFIRGFLNSIGVNLEEKYLSIVKDLLGKRSDQLFDFVERAAYSSNNKIKWERLIRRYQ